jgi:hypothetical protein
LLLLLAFNLLKPKRGKDGKESFLARCKEIRGGLHSLSDDLYASLEDGSGGPERDELVKQAQEKARLYNALWAELDDEDDKDEVKMSMYNYIEALQGDLQN